MSKKNNIENLFREKMLKAEVTPPADVKRAIDDALDFPKSKGRLLALLLAILFLSGLSISAFFFFKNQNSTGDISLNKIENNSTSITPDQKSDVESKEILSKERKSNLNNTANAHLLPIDSVVPKQETAFVPANRASTNTPATSLSSTQISGNTLLASNKANEKAADRTETTPEINAEVNKTGTNKEEQSLQNNSLNTEHSNQDTSTQVVGVDTTSTTQANEDEKPIDETKGEVEKENTKADDKKDEKKTTPSQFLTGYSVGIEARLASFKPSLEITSSSAPGNQEKINYRSIMAYQIYGQLKALDVYNLQLGAQYQNGSMNYETDSTYTQIYQYIDSNSVVYTYDTSGMIIDSSYSTVTDTSVNTIAQTLSSSINYFSIPVSIGRTFILNPNGDENLKLTTNLGADLRFTSLKGDINGLVVNPFSVNFVLRNTLAYQIGDFDIILPIQVSYNPKSRILYQETRIDPKSSFSLGLGIQYNF
ncbi:hypothetical protein [Lishizhenia sp.]|uniref:hypothetical protein n=1 Tax=Lishizhenia sp. TaxID=2497594 RepID=UPI00299EAE25|nr:hypothetical protein [Lishizhenia sp.]MDX1446768.1 hypothetical protein [Lishizhenia sp.]